MTFWPTPLGEALIGVSKCSLWGWRWFKRVKDNVSMTCWPTPLGDGGAHRGESDWRR